MNYIRAIIEAFKADPDISSYVGDRVEFLRQELNTQRPFITFQEGGRENNFKGGGYGGNAMDSFPITFSIVVDQSDSWRGRELRELLKEKLNGFNGVLYRDNNDIIREGNIGFEGDTQVQYYDGPELVLWQSTYLFKARKKYFIGNGKDISGEDIG